MAEGILKFDELKVCTKLAEAYLEKKSEFCSIGFLMDNLDHGCDRYLKKVYYYTSMKDALLNNLPKAIDIDPEKLFALAQKIEENVQLFCQLDYLYREIPINDTKNIDLPLICQSLVYRASFKDAELVMQFTRCTNINESTPLFHLGQMAYCTFPFVICCTPATVAVCTLFAELCKEVGLEDAVYLIIAPEKEAQSKEARRGRGGGCVGVVGARCDVDSAVDAFLAADVPLFV